MGLTRRNPGCAFGPCNDSRQVGGPGCHLCDDIATLPQRGRGAVLDELTSALVGETQPMTALAAPAPTKTKARETLKRRPQIGRLL